MTGDTRKPRGGFTIIELVVVVSIVTLLTSIMLPALTKAREHAKMTICQINQGQMGAALNLYAIDYNDWYPPSPSVLRFPDGSLNWGSPIWLIPPPLGRDERDNHIRPSWPGFLGEYLPESASWSCPAAPGPPSYLDDVCNSDKYIVQPL